MSGTSLAPLPSAATDESKVPERVRLDVPGALTVTGGLLAVVYAIIERSVPAAVVGVVLLVSFWMIERRAAAPLAPARILDRPTVKWESTPTS